ncbi:MAG: Thivi_2564 family membrane protein [Bacteroidales bacterium]
MPVLTILIVILVVGVILWLVNSYIPMQNTVKRILNAVVIIILVIWLLKVFGVLDSLQIPLLHH